MGKKNMTENIQQENNRPVSAKEFLNSDVSKYSEKQLQKFWQTYLNLKSYQEKNLWKYFVPNQAQENFIRTPEKNPGAWIWTFSAGNGVGKTTTLINIICNLIYPADNFIFSEIDFYKNFKRPSRGRIVSDPTTIKEKIIPELEKWLSKGTYTTEKRMKPFESVWTFSGGSRFDIMTYEQDPKEFESVELDWILFDEIPPRAIYKASVSRFRFGGLILMGFTPCQNTNSMSTLGDIAYIYDNVVAKSGTGTGKSVVYGDIENNCIEHGKNGILKHSDIEKILAEYDPLELEARESGKFIHLSGLYYPMYDNTIHCIRVTDLPFKISDVPLFQIIDPHDRKPFCSLWFTIYQNAYYFLAEYPTDPFEKIRACDFSLKQFGDIFRLIENENKFKIEHRYIDPLYAMRPSRQKLQTQTLQEALRKDCKLFYDKTVDNTHLTGHKRVQDLLRYDKTKPISFTNKPLIYFVDTLYNCKYAMLHYRHGKIDPMTSEEVVCEDGKDFADCVRYAVMSNARNYFLGMDWKGRQFKSRIERTKGNLREYIKNYARQTDGLTSAGTGKPMFRPD